MRLSLAFVQVHGLDIVRHYELLRDYLCMFAGSPMGLPDLEHHKVCMISD